MRILNDDQVVLCVILMYLIYKSDVLALSVNKSELIDISIIYARTW